MPFDLSHHPHFTSWTDPESGVESFLLTERAAPVQQSFYFTSPSLSPDERWLWFYAAFPPAPYRVLGVVSMDPDDPEIHLFPETAFSSNSPLVAAEGDAAYFCSGTSVWRKPMGEPPERVCTLSDDYVAGRELRRFASHLTMSADGKYFLLDGEIGNIWFIAVGDPATGEVRVLHEFGRRHDHAQFSPVDPNLFLIAQDWWNDTVTGRHLPFDQRTWLMDVQQTRFDPLVPNLWFRHGDPNYELGDRPCHEWWSSDGLVCYTDYDKGAFECSIDDRKPRLVWKGPLCHTHCDATGRFWCADESPYKWKDKPCEVKFFDRESQKEIHVAAGIPPPPWPRNLYHIDPHPQISPKGTYVVYTTTVRGMVDVALAPMNGILERLNA